MVINTNISALTSANNLNNSTNMLNESLARLSSGSKITTPADDPAGLAESISLNALIGQTTAANSNVSNAVSVLANPGRVFAAGRFWPSTKWPPWPLKRRTATKTDDEQADYQKEFSTLSSYITDTASKSFNAA